MSRKQLVFDALRAVELGRADPLDKALIDLLRRYDLTYDVRALVKRLRWLESQIWTLPTPQRPPRGAPMKWGATGDFHAYLVVESELRAARKKNPKAKLSSVINKKFRDLRGKPWRILTDARIGGGEHLDIADEGRARSRYYAGRRLVQNDLALARKAEFVLAFLAQKDEPQ